MKFLHYGEKSGQVAKMISKIRKEKISIIIPCFNEGILLERCLNSAINQTWQNKEIVLVNDGSKNKITYEIIEKYRNISGVKIIEQINKGLPSARNLGGKNAKGNYLYFLDSDDWIEPETLENMFFFLKSNKEAGFIFSDIVLEGKFNKKVQKEYNFFEQLFINQLPYCIFISKETWLKVGGYDEKMKSGYEDWELNIRLGYNEKYGKRLALPLFHYNVSYSGMLLSKTSKRHSKIWKYIINKNKNLFKLNNIFSLWKKWRGKPSTYPLFIFFIWYFFFRFFPETLVSKIFIISRNFKWLFTRSKIFKNK